MLLLWSSLKRAQGKGERSLAQHLQRQHALAVKAISVAHGLLQQGALVVSSTAAAPCTRTRRASGTKRAYKLAISLRSPTFFPKGRLQARLLTLPASSGRSHAFQVRSSIGL